jgi:hypothetical protein
MKHCDAYNVLNTCSHRNETVTFTWADMHIRLESNPHWAQSSMVVSSRIGSAEVVSSDLAKHAATERARRGPS